MKPTDKTANIEEQDEVKAKAKEMIGSDAVTVVDEDDGDPGLYTHKFAKPITYEGKIYEELTFDFNSLTGGDAMDVEEELQASRHVVLMRTFDPKFLTRMCARACTEKVGYDIFRAMPSRDYSIITNRSKNFL